MTQYLFEDNAQCNLASAVGAADVTITLESGGGAEFPNPGTGEAFFIYVYEGSAYEWMLCTSRSGDVLTVTRAQEGTSAQSFTADATVELRLNSTILETFLQKGVYRTVTSDPDGSLAASYDGEEVYNSATGIWWKHCTGTTWVAMNS